MELLAVSAKEVERGVSMLSAIDAVENAYVQLSFYRADVPLRVPLRTPRGVTLFMPGYLKDDNAMAVKIVSVYGENPAKGLPTVTALVIVVDAETGIPKAAIEGTYLTALRTGAASGVATRLLAREDSGIMAMIGAGGQAPTQISAVCAVRPIREVRIYDINTEAARALCERMSEELPDIDFRIASSPREAVRDADVINTATISRKPVFDAGDVSPGTHVNGIGAYTPEMQEIPAGLVARARVVIDSRTSALAEAGDLIIPLREGAIREEDIVEIGEVLAGKAPGRQSPDEITFFKSVGNAVQDVAVARIVLQAAEKDGWGTRIPL